MVALVVLDMLFFDVFVCLVLLVALHGWRHGGSNGVSHLFELESTNLVLLGLLFALFANRGRRVGPCDARVSLPLV